MILEKSWETPSQDKTKKEISALKDKINDVCLAKNVGLRNDDVFTLQKLKIELKRKEKFLSSLEKTAKRQQKFRNKKKGQLKQPYKLILKYPTF